MGAVASSWRYFSTQSIIHHSPPPPNRSPAQYLFPTAIRVYLWWPRANTYLSLLRLRFRFLSFFPQFVFCVDTN
jgi:hypothetical protein